MESKTNYSSLDEGVGAQKWKQAPWKMVLNLLSWDFASFVIIWDISHQNSIGVFYVEYEIELDFQETIFKDICFDSLHLFDAC